MNKQKIKNYLEEKRIIAIIRGVDISNVSKLVEALLEGPIDCLEFTFDNNEENYLERNCEKIRKIKQDFGDRVLIGAGTVLRVEEVDAAYKSGASFILSPNTNVNVIKRAKELNIVAIPGAMTPTEVVTAYEAGADYIKLFPANDLGVGYLKSLRGPLPHIPIMAVGGINDKNIKDYANAGAVGFGIGSELVNRQHINNNDFDLITKKAKEIVKALED